MQRLEELFSTHLQEWRTALPNDALHAPIRYFMDLPGKRVRPLLTMIGCELFGGQASDVLNEALGVELFHNFTLLHDDIMDRSPLRRGQPTVHVKWSMNAAILSGDAMLVHAYSKMGADAGVLAIFNKYALAVCDGQQRDMDLENEVQVPLAEYREMIRLKTAVLLSCALRIGACKAGASASQQNAIGAFGEELGLAFQLRDDMLDAFGDPKLTGKERGSDLRNAKKTWLLIRGLELSEQRHDVRLHAELKKPTIQRDVNAMCQTLSDLGVEQEATVEVHRAEQAAHDALGSIGLPKERTQDLLSLVEKLKGRKS